MERFGETPERRNTNAYKQSRGVQAVMWQFAGCRRGRNPDFIGQIVRRFGRIKLYTSVMLSLWKTFWVDERGQR